MIVLKRIKTIVKLLICAAAAAVLIALGFGKELFKSKGFSLDRTDIGKMFLVVFCVLAAQYLVQFVLGFLNPKNHRARTVVTLISNLVRYAAILAILVGVLTLLGVNVPTILAGIGVVALIVGFAAESLITDIVTGFFILMDNQYNVGDIIEVGGFRGTVTQIGIRTTSLTDTGGNVKIVNNSDMKNILNRSDNSSKAVADFSIPYGADLAALEQKIPALTEEIYEENKEIFKSAPKYLGVQALGDSAVTLRFIAEVGESDIYAGARALNRALLLGFRKLGVECPFPQVDVHSR